MPRWTVRVVTIKSFTNEFVIEADTAADARHEMRREINSGLVASPYDQMCNTLEDAVVDAGPAAEDAPLGRVASRTLV